MKKLDKKTLVLIFASVLSVTCSFATEQYTTSDNIQLSGQNESQVEQENYHNDNNYTDSNIEHQEQQLEQKENMNAQMPAQTDSIQEEQISQENKTVENHVQTQTANTVTTSSEVPKQDKIDALIIFLSLITLVLVIAYLYTRAKNKLRNVVGENFVIDLDETEDLQEKKNSKLKKIGNKINNFDKQYSHHNSVKNIKEYQNALPVVPQNDFETQNIINLDEIIKTQDGDKKEDVNADLEDFLSTYSFEEDEVVKDEEPNVPEQENIGINSNEEFYNEVINNDNINFDQDDCEKINILLDTEITEDGKKQIATTAPLPSDMPKKQKYALENLVLTYMLERNITFSADDISALRQLMSVEIDKDFLIDLKKSTETFDVKNEVPKKEENKLKNKSFVKKMLNGYEVDVLKLDSELPDLKDILQHPEKYEEKPIPKKEAKESDLMARLDNVVFKPFEDNDNVKNMTMSDYSSYNDDEFDNQIDINDLLKESEQNELKIKKEEIKGIAEENNFEKIVEKDTTPEVEVKNSLEKIVEKDTTPEVEVKNSLEKNIKKKEVNINNSVIQSNSEIVRIQQPSKSNVQKPLQKQIVSTVKSVNNIVNKPIQSAKPKSAETQIVHPVAADKIVINDTLNIQKESDDEEKMHYPFVKDINGVKYTVLSAAELTPSIGCYLTKKMDEYVVLGYVLDETVELKQYKNVTSENIQCRLKEKISETVSQYIVRIGRNKFILNIDNCKLQYVMDLC